MYSSPTDAYAFSEKLEGGGDQTRGCMKEMKHSLSISHKLPYIKTLEKRLTDTKTEKLESENTYEGC